MLSTIQGSSDSPVVFCCGAVALASALAITLLVVGILGSNHTLHMSAAGARAMITIGSGILLGLISGTIKLCCK